VLFNSEVSLLSFWLDNLSIGEMGY
jgi:hypothetical protein